MKMNEIAKQLIKADVNLSLDVVDYPRTLQGLDQCDQVSERAAGVGY